MRAGVGSCDRGLTTNGSTALEKLAKLARASRGRERGTPNQGTMLYWRGRADAYEAAHALLARELGS